MLRSTRWDAEACQQTVDETFASRLCCDGSAAIDLGRDALSSNDGVLLIVLDAGGEAPAISMHGDCAPYNEALKVAIPRVATS